MGDEAAEVGLEDDAERPAHGAGALHGQVEVGGHRAAGAVGADEVAGADLVLGAGQPVADRGGDALVVLHVADVLGVEADPGAAGLGRLHEQRLGDGLRGVDHGARAGQPVVRVAALVGPPRQHPAELLAGQAGAEGRVAHRLPRGRLPQQRVLQPHVAQRLHRPLVGDVRPRGVGEAAVLGDHERGDAVGREEQGRRGAGGARAHDEDVDGRERACAGRGVLVGVLVGVLMRGPPSPDRGVRDGRHAERTGVRLAKRLNVGATVRAGHGAVKGGRGARRGAAPVSPGGRRRPSGTRPRAVRGRRSAGCGRPRRCPPGARGSGAP